MDAPDSRAWSSRADGKAKSPFALQRPRDDACASSGHDTAILARAPAASPGQVGPTIRWPTPASAAKFFALWAANSCLHYGALLATSGSVTKVTIQRFDGSRESWFRRISDVLDPPFHDCGDSHGSEKCPNQPQKGHHERDHQPPGFQRTAGNRLSP